ncbi:hypothetical protein INT48_005064 [Thamnidium elegans]|uniref:Uncharacterized protein n=1 Tax=Thamnidium elegans TaxID=101142 RepID=A0A8H7SFT5_9FUNG|nr:hypothetical protein INT48_005064 [Thamnidium elegans]
MSNPNDQFEADLQAIESAMSSMMQGAFSSMFQSLVDTAFDHSTVTTTIIDGNNIRTKTIVDGKTIRDDNNDIQQTGSITLEDEFGGNDFKRLRNKAKQNHQGLISTPMQNKIEYNQQTPETRSDIEVS